MPSDRVAGHDAVPFARFIPSRDLRELLPQPLMRGARVRRNHHAAGNVALELRRARRRRELSRADDRLGMADSGRDAKQHRDAPALGDLDGRRREIVRLLRVRRLQHRHARGDGVVPVVLFVLARSHARVVGRDHDQRAGHAGVRGGEERVGGHVQADVLHRHHRARVTERRAEGDFHRDLLIRRPLRPPAQFREAFQNLGGRRSGIAGAQRDTGIPGRQRNRLVAAQQQSFSLAHTRV